MLMARDKSSAYADAGRMIREVLDFTERKSRLKKLRGAPANAGTNSVGAKREGAAEGGCGGNSAAPERKIEASPAACSVRSRSQQKSFLFLLEEKNRARAK
jgi:hypothetical protein